MGIRPFEVFHPAVPAVLFCGIVVLSMLSLQPVCAAILLAGGLLFAALTQGVRTALSKLRWQLPLLALICLINPVFSAMGSTLVLRVAGHPVYAESLAYGAVNGSLLVSVLAWIEGMGIVIGQDELLVLSGGLLPSVTLAVSMAMRLVPQLLRRARTSLACLGAVTSARPELRATQGLTAERVRVMGSLATWALEDSIECADSLRARGWGSSGRRTRFRPRPLRMRDAVALVGVAALLTAAGLGVSTALATWRFYPTMSGHAPLWAYASLVVLAGLPSALVLYERIAWGEGRGSHGVCD